MNSNNILYIKDIPYPVRCDLVDLLNVSDSWKKLAGALNFSSIEIDLFELEIKKYGSSPAEAFWKEYSRRNPTVYELYNCLANIKHYTAMRHLLPYVPEILHGKIPGLAKVKEDKQKTILPKPLVDFSPSLFNENDLPGPETRNSLFLNKNQQNIANGHSNLGLPLRQTSQAASDTGSENLSNASSLSDNNLVWLKPTAPVSPGSSAKLNAFLLHNTPNISYKDILIGTNNFNPENVIGSSHTSIVYRCTCPKTKTMYSVQRMLKCDDPEDNVRQHEHFMRVISDQMNYRHENIIQLYGYNMNEADLFLIYEYLPNGSVHDRIICKDQSMPLNWMQRINIMLGITRGLLYLHEKGIIHYNLKSTNVILDKNFDPKLMDIGKSVIPQSKAKRKTTTRTANTKSYQNSCGYLSTDFITDEPSFKSDIFSLGVLMAEICFGAEAYDEKRKKDIRYIYDWIYDSTKEKLLSHMDPKADWPKDVYQKVLGICKLCIHRKTKGRPPADKVYSKLEKITEEFNQSTENYPEYKASNQLKSLNIVSMPENLIAQPKSAEQLGKPIYPPVPQSPEESFSTSDDSFTCNYISGPDQNALAAADMNDSSFKTNAGSLIANPVGARRKKKCIPSEWKEYMDDIDKGLCINQKTVSPIVEESKHDIEQKTSSGTGTAVIDNSTSCAKKVSEISESEQLPVVQAKNNSLRHKMSEMDKYVKEPDDNDSLNPEHLDTSFDDDAYINDLEKMLTKQKSEPTLHVCQETSINDQCNVCKSDPIVDKENKNAKSMKRYNANYPSISLGEMDELLNLESLRLPNDKPSPNITNIPDVTSSEFDDLLKVGVDHQKGKSRSRDIIIPGSDEVYTVSGPPSY